MVALCNRADHIFMLFLSFFPRLISAVGDWMYTILWHMVWPYSPAVKAPILGEACIRVRIKYFYSFMTFGPY